MKKLDVLMILMLISSFLCVGFTSFASDCSRVRDETLRLHIIANSDSSDDQALKLAVRDKILDQYGEIFGNSSNLQLAVENAEKLTESISDTAGQVIAANNRSYSVRSEVTRMYFPTRTYEKGITMPAGEYTAVRVVIGSGEGKNWWCVLYPPLCIPAASNSQAQQVEEQIRNLSGEPKFVAKFALLELVESLKKEA